MIYIPLLKDMWPDWLKRCLWNMWGWKKLERKNDGSSTECPRTGLCFSVVEHSPYWEVDLYILIMLQSKGGNFVPSVLRHWQGQCHLSLIFDTGLGFGLLCSSAEQAESFACWCSIPAWIPSWIPFCASLITFPGRISLSPLTLSRHVGFWPSSIWTKFI